jgi:hypothetical protein
VKTTIEISDALLIRARKHAQRRGVTLRAVVEDGLRRVLASSEEKKAHYELPDRSVGVPGGPNPLESLSWQDLRDEIYGGR